MRLVLHNLHQSDNLTTVEQGPETGDSRAFESGGAVGVQLEARRREVRASRRSFEADSQQSATVGSNMCVSGPWSSSNEQMEGNRVQLFNPRSKTYSRFHSHGSKYSQRSWYREMTRGSTDVFMCSGIHGV